MITRKSLNRRTFLRGAGTAVALPFLDAMVPAFAGAAGKAPVRMAFVYVPNGIMMDSWNPDYEGALRELPRTLKPNRVRTNIPIRLLSWDRIRRAWKT